MTERLRIRIGDFALEGVLETALAPAACEFVQSLIPLKREVIHARWSGEALWVPLEGLAVPPIGLESPARRPTPGHVLFYPGGVSPPEILVPYGAAKFACRYGPLSGSHFLTLGGHPDRLAELGRRVLWMGAHPIAFERIDNQW